MAYLEGNFGGEGRNIFKLKTFFEYQLNKSKIVPNLIFKKISKSFFDIFMLLPYGLGAISVYPPSLIQGIV